MRKPKMYFVNIRAEGFIGWNNVYAISLADAKEKLGNYPLTTSTRLLGKK